MLKRLFLLTITFSLLGCQVQAAPNKKRLNSQRSNNRKLVPDVSTEEQNAAVSTDVPHISIISTPAMPAPKTPADDITPSSAENAFSLLREKCIAAAARSERLGLKPTAKSVPVSPETAHSPVFKRSSVPVSPVNWFPNSVSPVLPLPEPVFVYQPAYPVLFSGYYHPAPASAREITINYDKRILKIWADINHEKHNLYHTLPKDVDKYLFLYGKRDKWVKMTGEKDDLYFLGGELILSDGSEVREVKVREVKVVFECTFNQNGNCYHRGIKFFPSEKKFNRIGLTRPIVSDPEEKNITRAKSVSLPLAEKVNSPITRTKSASFVERVDPEATNPGDGFVLEETEKHVTIYDTYNNLTVVLYKNNGVKT